MLKTNCCLSCARMSLRAQLDGQTTAEVSIMCWSSPSSTGPANTTSYWKATGLLMPNRAMCIVRAWRSHAMVASHSRHRMTPDIWQRMSVQQQTHATDNCFRIHPVPTSTSIEGTVTDPGSRRKAHQRESVGTKRTTTISKWLRITASDRDNEWHIWL